MTEAASAGEVHSVPLADALGERYLAYALSTIMARSLPNVRDGLKPVQRRLLYAMLQLKLDPGAGFKKCARVVGDVIGKYHPHGDAAVYDALVRLAQTFAARYPLVDGRGNFGDVDGDNAAAMRYTEASLTAVAAALLDGIDEDAVDFHATYDGGESEPVVLPASFPNLLANGATGIAVGMATSIPPHNVGEVSDALIHLIDAPDATTKSLVRLMPGPDFPTGGVLVEPKDAVVAAYEAGRGSFRLRARWTVEKLKHGQYQIVVTEVPYLVQKARLIEKIAELVAARKLALVAGVRDESTEQVRIVLEPRSRAVDPDVLMESLFRTTELEVRIGLNMNVLDAHNTPGVMGLERVLRAFLDHRHEVLLRRTRHRLAAIVRRLEVLEGYLVAYRHLEEVIRIIREEDDPKPFLMARWRLSEVQAEAILNMRLRALRRLEEKAIGRERKALRDEKAGLDALLAEPERRWGAIREELLEVKQRFGQDTPLGRRRTSIGEAQKVVALPEAVLVEREPVTVICSDKGWIRALQGHNLAAEDVKYKEGDRPGFVLEAETTDALLVFATNGRFYTLAGDKLPRGRGFGEPLRLMIDLKNGHDIVALLVHRPGRRLLLASSDGRGFVIEEDAVLASTRAGKQVLNPGLGAEAAACVLVDGDAVAVLGDNRKLLVFPLAELPVMTRGRGVILQRYRQGGLADVKVFTLSEGLSWRIGDRTRTETDLRPWLGRRGNAGRLPPAGFPRANRFT
ncbi:MAG: DNA topoisomerase IV subunit A [Alphaproteobacteria bacterium]